MTKPLVKSFTLIDTYQNCARMCYAKYVIKIKEPETPELKEGNRVHKALEMRVGKGHMLSPDLQQFEGIANSLVAQGKGKRVITELALGIDRSWQPCGFFDDQVWLRGKIDVAIKGGIGGVQFDYKTGKQSDKTLQLEITNVLALLTWPDLQEMTGFNLWLKNLSAPPSPCVKTTRADLPHLTHNVGMMIAEIEDSEATGNWPATPSGLCGYCPDKTCQFNRNKR